MNESDRMAQFRAVLPDVLVALLAGVAGVAGSYAITGFTPNFVVAPIATFTSQTMPAAVVTFAITTLGELGDRLNLVTAIGLAVVLLAVAALVALAIGQRYDAVGLSSGLAAVFGWLVATALTMAPVPSVGAGLGVGAIVAAGELTAAVRTADGDTVDSSRRAVLGSVAGTLGIGLLGYLVGSQQGRESTTALDTDTGGADNVPLNDTGGTNGTDGQGSEGSALGIEDLLTMAEDHSLDVDGLEGLLSGDDFYEVDIYNVNPDLSTAGWTLSVTGAVESDVELTYDELRDMPSQNRFNTLRCVGEGLNGHKMDNALWTGVPIMDVIERANPQGEFVVLRDGDGYYEEFSVEALRTGLLAYGKDGSTLPRGHGFPVRALIPGHWGEINVKWLTEIEIVDEEATGYWEERGWHGTGPVNTVAKLHAVNQLDDGRLQVGGHAYAGTRGIETVEVSIDGGDSWNDATLSESLPEEYGTDVWRQWMYEYQPPEDEHEVVVRAIDGTGTLQPKEKANAYPNGPSGWVSRTLNMMGSTQ